MATDLNSLYVTNPGTENASAGSATASLQGATKDATAQQATATTQSVNPNADVSTQLNKITSQDSPYIKQAQQQGMLAAARRGLQNSSIAAGNSEAAAVSAALPMAQQNASQEFQQGVNNQNATNTAANLNAQLGTNVSEQNANAANTAAGLNAQLQTNTSQQNAQLGTQTSLANTQQANAMRSQVLQANADFNKQYLVGQQSKDLATIQGQYQQLIATNDSAAKLFDSFYNSISAAMANNQITPDRLAQEISVAQNMLENGLKLIDSINQSAVIGGG